VALPLIAAYALAAHASRPLKRLYDQREETLTKLAAEYHRKLKK
jgi:hypothetical protein